jgi:DNA-binding NarL/FixJ family response regulator
MAPTAIDILGRPPAARIRVAVAEPHPLVRLGAVRSLERDGRIAVVGDTGDGAEAIELAHRMGPDVMVLELRMPDLGGALLLERLRSELPDIRALVLTASESRESVVDALACGAAGYLSKRTTGAQLCEAVVATHAGESAISPQLVHHLVSEFSALRAGSGFTAPKRLARRELELVKLIAAGLTDREIAARLYMSRRTVQNDLARIREKTGVHRRSELARWAADHSIA